MYCPKCGKENADDARFCSSCGHELAPLYSDAPAQQAQTVVHFSGGAAPSRPRKNTTVLVLGIIGSVSAFIGGVLWASCADMINCSDTVSNADGMWIYTALFVVLGIGGAVISLIGSIQAYNYGHGRLVLSLIGLLFEAGCLAAQIILLMSLDGPGYFFSLSSTIIALILLLAETVFSAGKDPNKAAKKRNARDGK